MSQNNSLVSKSHKLYSFHTSNSYNNENYFQVTVKNDLDNKRKVSRQ